MKRTANLVFFAVLLSALTLSLSLLLKHLDIPLLDACSVMAEGACDEALASDFAVQFGLPLAGWGVVYFVLFGGFWIMRILFPESFSTVGAVCAFLLSLGGILYSSLLLVLMAVGSIPVCPICIVIHILNLSLPGLILWAGALSLQDVLSGLSGALGYLRGSRVDNEETARWNLAGIFLVILIGLVAYQWILLEYREATPVAEATDPDVLWTEFQNAPQHDFTLTAADAVKGDANSAIEIVVFSDFQCPYCKTFATYLEPVFEQYRSRLYVVFRHFPLSPQCNPALSQELHPFSCQAALLAQAAQKQGRFWEMHDQLFAGEILAAADLDEAVRRAGLDPDALRRQAQDESVQQKVQSDIQQALTLQIPGTPAVFLNGRMIRDARQLEYLLERLAGQ